MDLVDLVRIAVRRWYIAVPGVLLTLIASVVVYSSVALTYRSSGSVLLFAPRVANVSENRLLGFNSLTVPASIVSEVVGQRATRERLASEGASPNYQLGLDPVNPAPL